MVPQEVERWPAIRADLAMYLRIVCMRIARSKGYANAHPGGGFLAASPTIFGYKYISELLS
jgi:hypothetical protein